jgi:hypothetical protein
MLGMRQGCPVSLLLFKIALRFPAIRQEEEIKGIQIRTKNLNYLYFQMV